MLGKSYFSLVQALHESRSFSEVAHLLTTQLPQQFEDDHPTIALMGEGPVLLDILGNGKNAEVARNEFDRVACQLPKHPLLGSVDFGNPGNLGFAASDYLEPGEYLQSDFNQGLPEEMQANDCLAGRLSVAWNRITLLLVCRNDGVFGKDERQVFDAVLFTARAVVERISSQSVEAQFRKFLLSASAGAPISLFSLAPSRELLPMNFQSLRQAENWWGVDEAYHMLSDEVYAMIRAKMEEAWDDPVVASFRSLEVDLGGGLMKVFALPKSDGEIFIAAPVPGSSGESSDDAVNAVLTKRQKEIMDWIAEGKTSAEAAIILDISPRTVEKHLEAVFQRLGVENRIAAVRRFLDLKAGHTI
ncbi:response regulator transcription factor [Haloferula chungangensis]|uniref:Response regulator transcription factor n=1 Tax=Haloferula chungangensis TaxID=1048331 RepID=A0ABW2LBA9_9BACT